MMQTYSVVESGVGDLASQRWGGLECIFESVTQQKHRPFRLRRILPTFKAKWLEMPHDSIVCDCWTTHTPLGELESSEALL